MNNSLSIYLFDGVLLIVFFACIIIGRRKGLLASLSGVIAAVAGITVSWIYSPVVSERLYDGFLRQRITGIVAAKLESAGGALPETLEKLCSYVGFSTESIVSQLDSGELKQEIASKIVDTLEQPVIIPAVKYAALIAGAVLVFACTKLLLSLLSPIVKLPVIRKADRAGGALFGILKGLAVVLFICCAAVIAEVLAPDSIAVQYIKTSVIFGFVKSVAGITR